MIEFKILDNGSGYDLFIKDGVGISAKVKEFTYIACYNEEKIQQVIKTLNLKLTKKGKKRISSGDYRG